MIEEPAAHYYVCNYVRYSEVMRTRRVHVCLSVLLAWMTGCVSSPKVIPESLESQVDESITFDQIIANPNAYKGRVVLIGGEVLKANGLRAGTQLEVLQLPLEDSQRPTPERIGSKGRVWRSTESFWIPLCLPMV